MRCICCATRTVRLFTNAANLLVQRFGLARSAGVLVSLGLEQRANREMESTRAGREHEPASKAIEPADSDQLDPEQILHLIETLEAEGVMQMQNPVERAWEEGVLDDVEEKMRLMDSVARQQEDSEADFAVAEWTALRTARKNAARSKPATAHPSGAEQDTTHALEQLALE